MKTMQRKTEIFRRICLFFSVFSECRFIRVLNRALFGPVNGLFPIEFIKDFTNRVHPSNKIYFFSLMYIKVLFIHNVLWLI